jgi:hypothetical protein
MDNRNKGKYSIKGASNIIKNMRIKKGATTARGRRRKEEPEENPVPKKRVIIPDRSVL